MDNESFPFVLPIAPIVFQIDELDPVLSKLTATSLRRCAVAFTVAGDDRNKIVVAALDAAADGTDLIPHSDGSKWAVGSRSYSHQQGSAMYNHTLELAEQEEVSLAGVEIDGDDAHS